MNKCKPFYIYTVDKDEKFVRELLDITVEFGLEEFNIHLTNCSWDTYPYWGVGVNGLCMTSEFKDTYIGGCQLYTLEELREYLSEGAVDVPVVEATTPNSVKLPNKVTASSLIAAKKEALGGIEEELDTWLLETVKPLWMRGSENFFLNKSDLSVFDTDYVFDLLVSRGFVGVYSDREGISFCVEEE